MFKDKLRELRISKGYSMDKLVEIYNDTFGGKLNKSTVSRYENGLQEPMFTVVKNFATLFNVTTDYLTDAESTFQHLQSQGIISPITTKRFPMLGNIACGKPIYADEDYETFVEASSNINADFCLTAKGDSMINARIFDGDIVFIKSQPDVENGEIAAVIINDEATLKRVYKYQNRIELRPENPMYDVLNYEGSELEQIQILGKAVAFQSYIR